MYDPAVYDNREPITVDNGTASAEGGGGDMGGESDLGDMDDAETGGGFFGGTGDSAPAPAPDDESPTAEPTAPEPETTAPITT